jgi:hypothetical protein
MPEENQKDPLELVSTELEECPIASIHRESESIGLLGNPHRAQPHYRRSV